MKTLEPKERILFHLQEFLGRLAIFFVAPLYFIIIWCLGYRIRDLREFRAECRRAFRDHEGPWLMCPNHLTMIDSVILTYAMTSIGTQIASYRLLPWNLPERDNFQRSIALSILCYLTKCIPVNRGGDRDELKKVLDKCTYLLERGQNLMIFPEGGRSRTGRVDTENYSYGVGRFLTEFENCRVMCLYLRGDEQAAYGTMPKPWQRFTVGVEVFEPEKPAVSGLRAQRDYAGQIIRRLAGMEEDYFASGGQRHSRSYGSGERREEPGYALSQPRLYQQRAATDRGRSGGRYRALESLGGQGSGLQVRE